jgi:hypothetical protein
MELEDIRQLLEGEGLIGVVQKATPDLPLDQLVVVLEGDDGQRRALQIAYLPDDDAEIEGGRLLQFYVGLDDVPPSEVEATHRRLDEVNRTIPLGAFHLHDELGALFYRHVALVPRGHVPAMAPVLTETVWLIDFILDKQLEALRTKPD